METTFAVLAFLLFCLLMLQCDKKHKACKPRSCKHKYRPVETKDGEKICTKCATKVE